MERTCLYPADHRFAGRESVRKLEAARQSNAELFGRERKQLKQTVHTAGVRP